MAPCFGCFGPSKKQIEQDRLASEDARAKAAEAAQRRQEQFEKSAQGRAARAQMAATAKQSTAYEKGEPVLKDIAACANYILRCSGLRIAENTYGHISYGRKSKASFPPNLGYYYHVLSSQSYSM